MRSTDIIDVVYFVPAGLFTGGCSLVFLLRGGGGLLNVQLWGFVLAALCGGACALIIHAMRNPRPPSGAP